MGSVPLFRIRVSLLLLVIAISVPISIDARLPIDQSDKNHHFPIDKQGEFASKLKSYDIITPVKVTDTGDFISHDLSTPTSSLGRSTRRKRHVEEAIHYHITLDGTPHRVRLHPNRIFLAPHAVVERRNKFGEFGSRIGNTTAQVTTIDKAIAQCHFIGSIFNQPESKVALSTCNGLRGFLKTKTDEFLIEPVKGHERSSEDPHSHLVYRKSALPSSEDHKDESCSAHEYAKGLEQRIRWERNRISVSNTTQNVKRRRKRSVSLERNVEVMVVTDKQMIDYYSNEDLNTYILTVMNMVSSIYHDASIGNAVNIIVVRIMLLETPQYEKELNISNNADDTLLSFCKWQQLVNPLSENHPHHHDVAVLLTRYNICSRSNNHCSTLGLAEIAGMCQPQRSCNVNEDTGLQIAYTIAHEIGHNFGMNHDGPVNGCGSLFGQHVMSPHLATDSIPITWSNCSRNDITNFLDREWGSCLEDEPEVVEYNFPELPPGAMYDASHQCRLNFGAGATHCDEMKVECDTLWCRINNRCVTRLEPSAEGTQCGKHKWCYHGKCVMMGDRPAAIHGNWGLWSVWSQCSRTCGAGVEVAIRHCNNPSPANGGRYCTGERRKYRTCNTSECPEGDPSFRATQCSKFDNVPYKGHNYTWQAVTLEDNPCQLNCKPNNEFYSVSLQHSVIDGTPCKPGTRDMCIHGVCKRVACDWTIEGSAQEDRCGMCHGDGTQCVTTKGLFNMTYGISYVPIVTFPIGTRNLRVEEISDAANYLAIKDYETGQYHLNGNWIIQWSGEYNVFGLMMYYKRENETESLFMPGPLKRKLTLMLLFQMRNPGVTWEYTIPHENATYTPEFNWNHSEWTICSQTCGGGTQVSTVQCNEKEAGLVEDKYCNGSRPTDHKNECNTQRCPAWWWSGPWQPCSLTCGDRGTMRRTVICVRSYGPTEQLALMDSNCVIDDKPHEEEECPDLSKCRTDLSWDVQPWIESCRGDPCEYETRFVKCLSTTRICDPKTRPINLRQCGNISCGRWKVENWGICSTTCGEGVQIRTVICTGGSACIRVDEPASVKECYVAKCSDNYETKSEWWHVLPTDSFEPKIITPLNDSHHKDSLKNKTANESSSDRPLSVYKSSMDVHNSKTTSIIQSHSDFFEKSNASSSDLGLNDSLRNKDRTIIDNNSSSTLAGNTKNEDSKKQPTLHESLIEYSEIPDDYYDDVDIETKDSKLTVTDLITTNSVNNNEGKLASSSDVTTVRNENTRIPVMKQSQSLPEVDSNILMTTVVENVHDDELLTKKIHFHDYNLNEITPKGSNISVNYDNYDYYNDEDYDSYDYDEYQLETKSERPTGIVEDKIEIENIQALEVIKRRNKKHKGKRNMFKKVKVHTGLNAFKMLQKFTKKANRKKYREKSVIENDEVSLMTPEFRWIVGSWSKCSEPCGGASKLRIVKCHNSTSDDIVPSWKCHALPPPDMQNCNMFKCLKWKVSDFSNCSEDCGPGIRTLNATCPKKGRCHRKDRPSLQENCQKQPCVTWVEGPWSMCTKSCGGGYQIRYVKCVDTRTQEASDDCEKEKPSHKRMCNSLKCQKRRSQQNHCKDHLDSKLCRRLVHMCSTKFFGMKCCRTCQRQRRG